MPQLQEELFARLPFWEGLDDAARETVRRGSLIRAYRRGDYIMNSRTECLGMILLLSGEMRAFFLSPEGREITLFSRSAGETCVLSAACVLDELDFETHLQAQKDSELFILGAPAFRRLTQEDLTVRCWAYERAANGFSGVVKTLQALLFLRFEQRLASFLLAERDRTGSPEVRMTHEQIAQRTNSAREVVARQLARFAGEGVVSMRRGVVRIEDEAALRALLE